MRRVKTRCRAPLTCLESGDGPLSPGAVGLSGGSFGPGLGTQAGKLLGQLVLGAVSLLRLPCITCAKPTSADKF